MNQNDSDGDSIYDEIDNCPDDYNPQQLDSDGDGIGDICDSSVVWYVNPIGSGDALTIQAGIDSASSGDTVLVAQGTYIENIDFSGKAIRLISEEDRNNTIIQPANPDSSTVIIVSGESRFTEFRGFTVTGGGDTYTFTIDGGASPLIWHNVFHGNIPFGGQNVEVVSVLDGSPLITKNLFFNNGGIGCIGLRVGASGSWVINNTLDNNERGLFSIAGGGYVINNIITNSFERGIGAYSCDNFTLLDYNDVWNNNPNYNTNCDPGVHDISENPMYFNPLSFDYSLNSCSPCINAGDPDTIYNDDDNTRGDMGAFPFLFGELPLAICLNLGNEYFENVIDHSPIFYWTYYDTLGDQTAYEFEVGVDPDWSVAEMWESGTVYTSDTLVEYAGIVLEDGTSYHYRARLNNGSVWGRWLEGVFRMNTIPSIPVPVQPVDEEVSIYDLQLIVSNSIDAEIDELIYSFEVYSDSELTILEYSEYDAPEQVSITKSSIVPDLLKDSKYWWRSRVFDGYEYSGWSDTESFLTRGGAIISVPTDQSTIQAAINLAGTGDTILVADGIYTGDGNRDIYFDGKNIILISENGPQYTTINCDGNETFPHRAILLDGGEDTSSIIDGFTITNAFVSGYTNTGAISCQSSGVTIRNCIITDNASSGISFLSSSSECRIFDCTISHNKTGVDAQALLTTITNSEIALNDYYGITAYGNIEMHNCLVWANGDNGLFVIHPGEFNLFNCTFILNRTGFYFEWMPPKDFDGSLRQLSVVENCISAFNRFRGFENDYYLIPFEFRCSNSYGNQFGDWVGMNFGPDDDYDNFSADPLFCDTATGNLNIDENSPCAPANNDCEVLIGAGDVGCDYCGDANGDLTTNISDAVYIVNYAFSGGNPPNPYESGDVNCDETVNVSDAVYIINFVFAGGNNPCDIDGNGIQDC